jgi:glycerophosphoryl diester phosphodiesterase
LNSVRVAGAAVIPRLDETLDAWPEIRFNIDVKAAEAAAPTVSAVRRTEAFGRVLLASFSDARLTLVRSLAGPDVATSMGMRAVAALRVASLARLPLRLHPSVVAAQVPVSQSGVRIVDRAFLRKAHRLGLQVHVWTIDNPAEMTGLLDLGVDGIMTDRIDVLREVYEKRGLWPPA